ncbi:MAG: alpha/beta hydrolase [Cyanobacteria bacterium J06626_18]
MNSAPASILKHYRRYTHASLRGLFSVGSLFVGTIAVFLLQTPKAGALEEIKLSYRGLQIGALPVEDLVNFANTGQPSQNIQALLTVIDMEPDAAFALLTDQTAIDNQLLSQATETFIGESFLQLVGTTVEVPEAPGQSWQYLRNALLAAATDNQVSVIEVLQALNTSAIVVDTEKVGEVSEQVRNDLAVIQTFFDEAFL